MSDNHFVAIAGNIGSGKTTAAKLLSQTFGYELFDEPVLDNRFLSRYYTDMSRWSFTLQLEFLIKRANHHELIETVPKNCIQDRSLLEDPEIFAKYLHGLGYMTDEELQLYQEYFERICRHIRHPDQIIYFTCSDIHVLSERIKKRGRHEEQNIAGEFLSGLNGYYAAFSNILRTKYNIDVLTFDVTHFDIHQKEQAKAFLTIAEAFLQKETTAPQQPHTPPLSANTQLPH